MHESVIKSFNYKHKFIKLHRSGIPVGPNTLAFILYTNENESEIICFKSIFFLLETKWLIRQCHYIILFNMEIIVYLFLNIPICMERIISNRIKNTSSMILQKYLTILLLKLRDALKNEFKVKITYEMIK